MSFVVLLGLFLLKHAALAHVIDFGYSWSRTRKQRLWYIGLLAHSAMECVFTVYLLHAFTPSRIALALGVECAALVVSSVVERGAPLQYLLRAHLLGESVMLISYLCIALFVL